MAKLLLEHGADPNKRYFLGAEISLVTESESLELLLTYGAHTESRDRQGIFDFFFVFLIFDGLEKRQIICISH